MSSRSLRGYMAGIFRCRADAVNEELSEPIALALELENTLIHYSYARKLGPVRAPLVQRRHGKRLYFGALGACA